MQHIASRQALDTVTTRLLTQAATLDDSGLGALGADLAGVAGLLRREVQLRRTLSETTTSADIRAGLLARILSGRIGQQATALVDYTVRQHWVTGRDLVDGFERLSRTALFLRAERAGELDEVEEQLFRFGRIVDANPELSSLLDDPAQPGDARAALVRRLLNGRANSLTVELLVGLAKDPAGRSFSFGIRELVEQAAQRKDKIVAVVTSAFELNVEERNRLVAALGRIYGRPVAVHQEVQPSLVGGLRIRVGDEVIDGSVAGRLDQLRSSLAS